MIYHFQGLLTMHALWFIVFDDDDDSSVASIDDLDGVPHEEEVPGLDDDEEELDEIVEKRDEQIGLMMVEVARVSQRGVETWCLG